MKKFLCLLLVLLCVPAWGAISDEDFLKLCVSGSAEEVRSALTGINTDVLEEGFGRAAGKGNLEAVKVFLEKEISKDSFNRALMRAATWGHLDVVLTLIDAGADVNANDKDGLTALMYAAVNGRSEVVKALLKAGANVDARKDDKKSTPLIRAAEQGHLDTVKILIDAGANVNAAGKDGRTALIMAAYKGHSQIITVLLDFGADTKMTDKRGYSAVTYAKRNEKLAGTDALIQLEQNSK